MSAEPAAPVRAFISYSWSTVDHEEWVLSLATRLREDAIDVILDKWELQPGRDPIAFMEQMVTDPTVKKVLLICDQVYKEKADGRRGGVGKEAQILTAEIYEKAAEDKYAALIKERDPDGRPYTPTYYHSRQYIDFSDPVKHEEKYEELLRWLYDKPQHRKPALGTVPSFISEPSAAATSTTSKMKQAEQFIKSDSTMAGAAIADFGAAMVQEFEGLRPVKGGAEFWDDIVIAAAAAMRPALRNLLEVISAEARYSGKNLSRIIRIYEMMGELMFRPAGVPSWSEDDFDAFRMVCYEGFLALIAILVAEERYDLLKRVVFHPYLIQGRERYEGPATTTYRVFYRDVESLRRRNDRLGGKRIDLYADLIEETYRSSYPSFSSLLQADLVLFLRGQIVKDLNGYEGWWPRTLIYGVRTGVPELFARSESRSFFDSWAPFAFGPISLDEFKVKVEKLNEDFRFSRGGFMGPSLAGLTNLANLGTRD